MKNAHEAKTNQSGTEKPSSTTQSCPSCKMHRPQWPYQDGYQKSGITYCCEGCAADTGCTCTVDEEENVNEDTEAPNRDESI